MVTPLIVFVFTDFLGRQLVSLRFPGIQHFPEFVRGLCLWKYRQSEQKQRSMKELERTFCVAQSTVAGIISRLEQKGFIEAFGDASDKRIKVVHITPAGEVGCREAAGYMAEAEQMLLHGFSEDEKALFNQLLARAAENIK